MDGHGVRAVALVPGRPLDNIFWHDHVDGIHSWGHGLVGQLIIEPKGATYHDPRTGDEVRSGAYVDIHTDQPVSRGLVEGSFRELALWTLDESPVTDSTLNLRAEPWGARLAANPDPSLLFSSFTHGDPYPIHPKAYAGDPFVIRTINVGPSVDTLHLDGHRFFTENRFIDTAGKVIQRPVNTLHYGISERYTAILDGGAGGVRQRPGDYLFFNGIARRFQQGAWSLLRVLGDSDPDLRPLPGHPAPAGAGSLPSPDGGRPPAAGGPGDPCPADAPQRQIAVSAIDLSSAPKGVKSVFVPTAQAQSFSDGRIPEPLVAHVAAGECLTVVFTNQRETARASFHVDKLDRTPDSAGVNVGFNSEQTVAPGATKTYRYYVDSRKIGSALVSDFGGQDTGLDGMYGSINVAPANATFTDPVTGAPRSFGAQVDVHVPGTQGYRDHTIAMADGDPVIGGSFMPYPVEVKDPALVNYRAAAGRGDDANTFSSTAHGDPATPLLRAYAGDPTKVHFLVAPGSEQMHVFGLGGQYWPFDPEIPRSQSITAQGIGGWETMDAELVGGAGGLARTRGDFFYGDVRRPFTQAGMWGLMRVMSDPACPIRPLDGLTCNGQDSIIFNPPGGSPAPGRARGRLPRRRGGLGLGLGQRRVGLRRWLVHVGIGVGVWPGEREGRQEPEDPQAHQAADLRDQGHEDRLRRAQRLEGPEPPAHDAQARAPAAGARRDRDDQEDRSRRARRPDVEAGAPGGVQAARRQPRSAGARRAEPQVAVDPVVGHDAPRRAAPAGAPLSAAVGGVLQ